MNSKDEVRMGSMTRSKSKLRKRHFQALPNLIIGILIMGTEIRFILYSIVAF